VSARVKTFTVIHVGPPSEPAPYAVVVAEEKGALIAGRADGDDFSWLQIGTAVVSSEDQYGVRVFTLAEVPKTP
jgi:uncharacterized OB-fold protein